jgi:hypothetical protein
LEPKKVFEKTVLPSDVNWGYLKIPLEAVAMFPNPIERDFDLKMGSKLIRRARLDVGGSRIWVGRRAFEEFSLGDLIECLKVEDGLFEVRRVKDSTSRR